MATSRKQIKAVFYRTAAGAEPVREWLKTELDQEERRTVGIDIATVEFGWPVGMPVCRPLGEGLREVRSSLSGGRTARVLFCVAGDRMVLLSAFVKKSRKTPQAEIEKARNRMKDLKR
ncbi:MAG: type II toxin-antitoxin system RelE/ParE family toxin [Oceanicaulis sp.]